MMGPLFGIQTFADMANETIPGVPVPVIVNTKFLPPRFLTQIDGTIIAGSREVVIDFVTWHRKHWVHTSPPCFLNDAGELVEELPFPAELGLTDAHGQRLTGMFRMPDADDLDRFDARRRRSVR